MEMVRVNKRGADRVRQGHLWIYRSDLVDVAAEGGSIVSVQDERGNFIGQALFSDRSQIALRFLSQSSEEIDRAWWRRRGPGGGGEAGPGRAPAEVAAEVEHDLLDTGR